MDNENFESGRENNTAGNNDSGYRPYSGYTPMQYPNMGQYPNGGQSYRGGQYPCGDIFEVSPAERSAIKKNYFGTFMRALLHGIGGFVLAQIVFICMQLSGYEFRYTEDGIAIIDWAYSAAGSIPSILFCTGIFLHDLFKDGSEIKDYFRSDKIKGSTVVGFFGMVLFAYGAAIILQNLLLGGMFAAGISPIAEKYLTEPELTPQYLVCEVIFTVLLAPIAEELMFRGVVLRRLSSVSQTFAIFVSAAIFGLMHGNLLQAVLGFVVGIVWGYAAVKTGSLILPIAGHILINFFASSVSFVEYFLGEDISSAYWTAAIILFIVIGLISFIAVLASGKIKFPEYTEYHRKRTFPIMLTCVSFWILAAYYIYTVISVCGPATEKLMGS